MLIKDCKLYVCCSAVVAFYQTLKNLSVSNLLDEVSDEML
jgi:hypothetical protein